MSSLTPDACRLLLVAWRPIPTTKAGRWASSTTIPWPVSRGNSTTGSSITLVTDPRSMCKLPLRASTSFVDCVLFEPHRPGISRVIVDCSATVSLSESQRSPVYQLPTQCPTLFPNQKICNLTDPWSNDFKPSYRAIRPGISSSRRNVGEIIPNHNQKLSHQIRTAV